MAQKQDRQALGLPISSGTTGIRTWDTRIFNPLLYQLSYSTAQERANIVRPSLLRKGSLSNVVFQRVFVTERGGFASPSVSDVD